MQQVQTIDRGSAAGTDLSDNGIELEAALRALHAARLHLEDVGGTRSAAPLVVRSRLLVNQAVSLLSAAARLHAGPA